jgi:hypothetical protein
LLEKNRCLVEINKAFRAKRDSITAASPKTRTVSACTFGCNLSALVGICELDELLDLLWGVEEFFKEDLLITFEIKRPALLVLSS